MKRLWPILTYIDFPQLVSTASVGRVCSVVLPCSAQRVAKKPQVHVQRLTSKDLLRIAPAT